LLVAFATDEPALGVEAVAVGAAAVIAPDADFALGIHFHDAIAGDVGEEDVPFSIDGRAFKKTRVPAVSAMVFGATRPAGSGTDFGPSPPERAMPPIANKMPSVHMQWNMNASAVRGGSMRAILPPRRRIPIK